MMLGLRDAGGAAPVPSLVTPEVIVVGVVAATGVLAARRVAVVSERSAPGSLQLNAVSVTQAMANLRVHLDINSPGLTHQLCCKESNKLGAERATATPWQQQHTVYGHHEGSGRKVRSEILPPMKDRDDFDGGGADAINHAVRCLDQLAQVGLTQFGMRRPERESPALGGAEQRGAPRRAPRRSVTRG